MAQAGRWLQGDDIRQSCSVVRGLFGRRLQSCANQMRLAFYSDQEIAANAPIDERVLRLIGVRRPQIGYVSSSPDPERSYFERKRAYYERLGADLTVYLDATSSDLDRDLGALGRCDAIHLTGGNTFAFLRWLKARRILQMLRAYATEDRGVVIGTSAGAILMTPTAETALLCGDTRPPGAVDDEALGLVAFHFWPHYVPGAERVASVQSSIRKFPALYACGDGTGIVISGAQVELYGAVSIAQPVAADGDGLSAKARVAPICAERVGPRLRDIFALAGRSRR